MTGPSAGKGGSEGQEMVQSPSSRLTSTWLLSFLSSSSTASFSSAVFHRTVPATLPVLSSTLPVCQRPAYTSASIGCCCCCCCFIALGRDVICRRPVHALLCFGHMFDLLPLRSLIAMSSVCFA